MPTIEDVARAAGVSIATVSRALRGAPNVSPSTRERVIKVADHLNYSIDPHASRLAGGRTMTVGVVIPAADQWYFSKLVANIDAGLVAQGYDMLLCSVTNPTEHVRVIKKLTGGSRVDGLILSAMEPDPPTRLVMEASKLPVVMVDIITTEFYSIGTDNIHAAYEATQYLFEIGHRHIAMIGGLLDSPLSFSIPIKRENGYRRALMERDLPVRPEYIVAGNWSLEGGYEAMEKLLYLPNPPTAVFALSDEMAIGAIKAIRDSGRRVPGDISVIGFDDHDIAPYVGLTTMAQPVTEYGRLAARALLDQIQGRDLGSGPHYLNTHLIERDTTAPPQAR